MNLINRNRIDFLTIQGEVIVHLPPVRNRLVVVVVGPALVEIVEGEERIDVVLAGVIDRVAMTKKKIM